MAYSMADDDYPSDMMPPRYHPTAPSFDPMQPRQLRRFFDDLQVHFDRCSISDTQSQKRYARSYVDIDTYDLWSIIPQSDSSYSWSDFVSAVYSYYPGSEPDRRYTLSDVDRIVADQLRTGISSLSAFAEYYRTFLPVTEYFRTSHRMSSNEQSRAFVRGIASDLWSRIQYRLDLFYPRHHPDDPYTLDHIYEAATIVLQPSISDNSFSTSPLSVSSISVQSPAQVLAQQSTDSPVLVLPSAPTSSVQYPSDQYPEEYIPDSSIPSHWSDTTVQPTSIHQVFVADIPDTVFITSDIDKDTELAMLLAERDSLLRQISSDTPVPAPQPDFDISATRPSVSRTTGEEDLDSHTFTDPFIAPMAPITNSQPSVSAVSPVLSLSDTLSNPDGSQVLSPSSDSYSSSPPTLVVNPSSYAADLGMHQAYSQDYPIVSVAELPPGMRRAYSQDSPNAAVPDSNRSDHKPPSPIPSNSQENLVRQILITGPRSVFRSLRCAQSVSDFFQKRYQPDRTSRTGHPHRRKVEVGEPPPEVFACYPYDFG